MSAVVGAHPRIALNLPAASTRFREGFLRVGLGFSSALVFPLSLLSTVPSAVTVSHSFFSVPSVFSVVSLVLFSF